jgi:hypothetical protein
VSDVIADFLDKRPLIGHEFSGGIVSTDPINGTYDWRRIPEWAVDNDLYTRWTCEKQNNHTWGIDLGERRSIDEIAIAWNFPHRRPGFTVSVSNDDSRFADGMSTSELRSTEGWTDVVVRNKASYSPRFWGVWTLDHKGMTDWRYVRVKVTDASNDWPVLWEVKLYGPAN